MDPQHYLSTVMCMLPQDEVSPISDQKRIITAAAVLTAVLILLPMAPEIADSVGVGQGRII
jgi:hypothetical protein